MTVVTRELRYHWDWGHRQNLPKAGPGAGPVTVQMAPWQRPQEKGIDPVIGLDVVEFVLRHDCDVVIIVSLDRDLAEIPTALANLKSIVNRPVRLEAAVPCDTRTRTLKGFHYTHQTTRAVFELVKDPTDYSVAGSQWTQPVIPSTLPRTTPAV